MKYYEWETWFAWRPIKVVQTCSDPYLRKRETSLVCYVWLRKVHRIKVISVSAPFGKYLYCLCGQHAQSPLSGQRLIDATNGGIHCLKGIQDNF